MADYAPRPKANKRAATRAVTQDIIDPDDPTIDPEMRQVIAGESARRVGAAGIQLRTRNPFEKFMTGFKNFFRGRR